MWPFDELVPWLRARDEKLQQVLEQSTTIRPGWRP
jgi:hypothetical protein